MGVSSIKYDCDVLVRGGGIAGRSLAMLLARDGFNVALVERATPMDEAKDPRAYALNAVAVQLLKDLRVWPQEKACPVYDMQVEGDAGAQLMFSAWRQEVDTLTHIVPAVYIEQALDHALQFQSRVQRFNADENINLPREKLIAICEGRDSPTRAQFGFRMKTSEYGHTALAARLSCEVEHGYTARQWFNNHVLALLPLAGKTGQKDQQEVSLVWSLPTQKAKELQALPQKEFEAALHEATHGVLGALSLQTPLISWPLRYARAERWVTHVNGQTAVLVADAAHAMHPLAGQGLNTGLGDVLALAKVLREAPQWRDLGDEKLLRPYERARQAAFLKIGGGCDALFHIFMATEVPLKIARNLGMRAINAINPVKHWLVLQAREK